jgi:hypothetical protein
MLSYAKKPADEKKKIKRSAAPASLEKWDGDIWRSSSNHQPR